MKTLLLFVFLMQLNFSFGHDKFDVSAIEKFQTKLNAAYLDAKTSPLTAEDKAHFKTLDFYPANKTFFVIATLVKTENEKPFKMKTSTSRLPKFIKYGEVHFAIDNKKLQLNVYQSFGADGAIDGKEDLFLPFLDATSGNESYSAGRYIDLRVPAGNTITIDFNTAYNPYCAYNSQYSCPIVPLENDLDFAIEAGVKKFHD